MSARPWIAFSMVTLIATLAACAASAPVTPKKDVVTAASKKPTVAPAVAATGTDAPATGAAEDPTPAPSPTKTPGPFDEAGKTGTPPPFQFPYTKIGQEFDYTLAAKAGAFPLGGTATIIVREVSATQAVIEPNLALTASFLGTAGSKQQAPKRLPVPRDGSDPFSVTQFISAGASSTTTSSPKPQLQVTSSVDKWDTETIKTDAGSFDCNKYQIDEVAGGETTVVVLWVDQKSGFMVKQVSAFDKLPDIGLNLPASIPIGKTTITLTLSTLTTASPEPGATGAAATQAASPDTGATNTQGASKAASPDTGATTTKAATGS